jgi:hypothetical protein
MAAGKVKEHGEERIALGVMERATGHPVEPEKEFKI